jgi:hypothetical protein
MISCPMDDGSAPILVLAYPGHQDVDLWIKLNGCATVSTGYISTAIPWPAPQDHDAIACGVPARLATRGPLTFVSLLATGPDRRRHPA